MTSDRHTDNHLAHVARQMPLTKRDWTRREPRRFQQGRMAIPSRKAPAIGRQKYQHSFHQEVNRTSAVYKSRIFPHARPRDLRQMPIAD